MIKLREISADLFKEALKGWKGNTAEIQAKYQLTEMQAKVVKRYTKELAASKGVLWAWDPGMEFFRVCPDNTTDIAKRMLDYAYGEWAINGRAIVHLINGARGMGYVTKKNAEEVTKRTSELVQNVRETGGKLKVTKPRKKANV